MIILAALVVVLGQWTPIVAALAGVVVPLLTETFTTAIAQPRLRLLVLTLLAAVGGAIATVVGQGGTFPLIPTLIAMLVTWLSAFAAQAGLHTSVLLPLRNFTARFGLGPKPPKPPTAQGRIPLPTDGTHYQLVGPADALKAIRVVPADQ